MALVGAGLIAGSLALGKDGFLKSVLGALGGAILSGGVFTATTKAYQYAGIFREEAEAGMRAFWKASAGRRTEETAAALKKDVTDALNAWSDNSSREEAEERWSRCTKSLLKHVLPGHDVSPTVLQLEGLVGIKNALAREAYYESASFEYTFSTPTKGFYQVDSAHEINLQPVGHQPVEWEYIWKELEHEGQDVFQPNITVDSERLEPIRSIDSEKRLTLIYKKQLSPGRPHRIVLGTRQRSSLTVEPFVRVAFSRHVRKLRVRVHCESELLDLHVIPVGQPDPFENLMQGDGHLITLDSLVPNQGFMIVVVERPRVKKVPPSIPSSS